MVHSLRFCAEKKALVEEIFSILVNKLLSKPLAEFLQKELFHINFTLMFGAEL